MRIKKKLLAILAVITLSLTTFFVTTAHEKSNVLAEENGQLALSVAKINPQTVLENYYIKNAKYTVPTLYENGQASSSSVEIKANGTEDIAVENGMFSVPACENLTFTFTTADGNVSKTVPVVDVGFGDALAIDQYFLANGGTIAAEKQYLSLVGEDATANYQFIRPLNAKSFSVKFKIPVGMDNFSKINFTLTDYLDETKSVNIFIINRDGNAALSINGGDAIDLQRAFANDSLQYILSLNGDTVSVSNKDAVVTNYADGTEFRGFSFAYMNVAMEGVNGDANVQLVNLNGQAMNNMKMDAIAPTLFFTEEPLSETLIGEEYSVIPVYVIDVLDPSAEALLSVRMPSGGYAKTADGIELKDVSAAESWSFVSTEYGKYKCTYSYKDATGNSNKSSYDVNVLDNVKPIITTDKEVIRGKVGQKLEIPVYTVSDNYSEAEEIVVAIQIIDTKYEISTLPKSGYIPTKAGVYTISYMAIDKNSNLGFAEVLCVVS